MRPSYDLILAIAESHPDIRQAENEAGVTAAQWASFFMRKLDSITDARQRDQVFSHGMAQFGVYTAGIAAFNKGAEEMMERFERRDRFHDEAHRLSEQSRDTPQFSSPERVAYVASRMQKARLTQALNDRMRERDARAAAHDSPLLPPNERVRGNAEDSRDLRSSVRAAVSSVPPTSMVELTREHDTLRDSVAASFEAHEDFAAQDDPLLDESLRSMSNAV